MTATKITTCSGRRIDLMSPNPSQITIADIAHHLARINRYSGATERPISVAQHSITVSKAVEGFGARVALLGLLHDAHEYVIGDISTPVAAAIQQILRHFTTAGVTPDPVALLKEGADVAIYQALNIEPPTEHEESLIKRADWGAFASEWIKAMPTPCPSDDPPVRVAWSFMSPERAYEAFIHRFRVLAAGVPGVREGT